MGGFRLPVFVPGTLAVILLLAAVWPLFHGRNVFNNPRSDGTGLFSRPALQPAASAADAGDVPPAPSSSFNFLQLPIPIYEDAFQLGRFLINSTDDALEDLTKFLCVNSWYQLVRGSGYRGLAFGAALLVFSPCDTVADRVGDMAESLMHTFFGIEPTIIETPRGANSTLQHLADDLVEDSFKAICLWSHVKVGSLIRSSALQEMGSSPLVRILGELVALGVPASKYSMCNEYGDRLGDAVQQRLAP